MNVHVDHEIEFRVRWYQQNFHRALVNREKDRLIAIWHRRAGKDEIVLNAFRQLASDRIGTYWHCFPEYKQARKAIWLGVNSHTGKRRIDEAFPPQIRKRTNDDDMFIEFKNGSTWQLLGSDRYDATVGSGPAGVAYSEWALCNPSAWAYHQPMIMESKGLAAFITTPRGMNHAKTMFERATVSDDWFAELLTAEQTGALSAKQLEMSLEEYIDLYGHDLGLAMFEQEYLCSFAGAMIGAIFGGEINRAEREGRICDVPIDPDQPVHTAWDLGKYTNNPLWCFQVIPVLDSEGVHVRNDIHIVDFYLPENDDLDEWCKWLDDRGYRGFDFVPHDIMVTEWGSKRTRMEKLKQKGRNPKRVVRVSEQDGINAGNQTIRLAKFDRTRCEHGIEGLRNYRREWDDDLKTFKEKPIKDWAEHIGSAFRYLGLAWRDVVPVPKVQKEPDRLEFVARADGVVESNMTIEQRIQEMIRRKRGEE